MRVPLPPGAFARHRLTDAAERWQVDRFIERGLHRLARALESQEALG